jgi:hypothetical protein
MIIKNITFAVSKPHDERFLKLIFKATDQSSQWIDEIKVFRLMEEIDPSSINYAVQLSFASKIRLEAFDTLILNRLIEEMQAEFPEPLLYFESHLEKVF